MNLISNIPKISITGNRHFYYKYKTIEMISVEISGGLYPEFASPISLIYDEQVICEFTDYMDFRAFSSRTIGKSTEDVLLILQEKNFDNRFLLRYEKASLTEKFLIKNLILAFHHVDGFLFKPDYFNLESQLFDSFMLDNTGKAGNQKDIYFISEKYKSVEKELLNLLVEVNLLCEIRITTDGKEFHNYFITLLKPGVDISTYLYRSPKLGDRAYSLWKAILVDRNTSINKYMDRFHNVKR